MSGGAATCDGADGIEEPTSDGGEHHAACAARGHEHDGTRHQSPCEPMTHLIRTRRVAWTDSFGFFRRGNIWAKTTTGPACWADGKTDRDGHEASRRRRPPSVFRLCISFRRCLVPSACLRSNPTPYGRRPTGTLTTHGASASSRTKASGVLAFTGSLSVASVWYGRLRGRPNCCLPTACTAALGSLVAFPEV